MRRLGLHLAPAAAIAIWASSRIQAGTTPERDWDTSTLRKGASANCEDLYVVTTRLWP
jgi:hypothetical protein